MRPPDGRRSLGASGERLAGRYLEEHGYTILARNVRLHGGEIDLIAKQAGCLVFVEVRLRRGAGTGVALESVTPRKQRRLQRLVAEYCAALTEPPENVRVDVVAVALDRAGWLEEIVLIENAVEES